MRILTLLFVTLFLAACGSGNAPVVKAQALSHWDNLQHLYQDRDKLIPVVITIVRQQIPGEEKLFEDVERARTDAMTFNAGHDTTTDKAAILKFHVIQMQVSQAIKWLAELPNTYTILKTDSNYQIAVQDLVNADRRAMQEAETYNSAAKTYNQELDNNSNVLTRLLGREEKRMEILPNRE